jgi:DNA (cytosine-5)-methyltransferase 1
MIRKPRKNRIKFVDLFAGCGGLSLGLSSAGLQGAFAIEKAPEAFSTFQANLLNGPKDIRFAWPPWMEKRAHSIDEVLDLHESRLQQLREQIDVIAGGPPCQGFSYAGRRKRSDPRNRLFEKYVRFVQDVRPKVVLLENVPGMDVAHGTKLRSNRRIPGPVPRSYYEKLIKALGAIGYVAEGRMLDAVAFGVPQKRPRLIVVGIDVTRVANSAAAIDEIFSFIEKARVSQLIELGLSDRISASQAISDLEVSRCGVVPCDDPASPKGFSIPRYRGPKTLYQTLMHENCDDLNMDSTRLAKHRPHVEKRFALILKKYRKGIQLGTRDRAKLGLLKRRTIPMAARRPGPTVTTLPDDVLHYREPRIMSVRESARLQSFPDWFVFQGKYTTGGQRRRKECPRYTQVGNAVPPLLARAIGSGIEMWFERRTKVQPASVTVSSNRETAEVA